MNTTTDHTGAVHKIVRLPNSLPKNGAVNLEIEEGVLIFRASKLVQDQIESLLEKQKLNSLSQSEKIELDQYENLDDYLSFLNRLTRNLTQIQN